MTKEERLGQAIADALETRAAGVGWMKAATAAAAAHGVSQVAVEKATRHAPELVQNPGAQDDWATVYVDSPADGSVYVLQGGELVQYPKHADDSLLMLEGEGGDVDFSRGVDEEWIPYLRYIERMLKGVTGAAKLEAAAGERAKVEGGEHVAQKVHFDFE